MRRQCYLTVCDGKEAVFLEASRAYEYATKNHGYVVRMYGYDDVKVDHETETTTPEVGREELYWHRAFVLRSFVAQSQELGYCVRQG